MNEINMIEKIRPIFQDALMRDDVELKAEYSAHDVPGWDSLSHIEIIMGIEEMFSIKFTTKDLDTLSTVGDLLVAINTKIAI